MLQSRDAQTNPDAASRMLNALRYYWLVARGYRLRPWKSPYIQWRMETFFGPAAAHLNARQFFHLMWAERARLRRFLAWVKDMRREERRRSRNL